MTLIRLTAKRQATLPKQLCEEMRVSPGDAIVVDVKTVDGTRVWLLRPADRIETPWFGRLGRYARGRRHDLRSVRRSVEKARRSDPVEAERLARQGVAALVSKRPGPVREAVPRATGT